MGKQKRSKEKEMEKKLGLYCPLAVFETHTISSHPGKKFGFIDEWMVYFKRQMV